MFRMKIMEAMPVAKTKLANPWISVVSFSVRRILRSSTETENADAI